MTTLGIGPEARRRLSARRIAEIVADELRRQIIDGELADGDLLPRQEVLVEQFNVSLVSLREALRILETEGLVSVRRGNRGGAVVHAPAKASAAYMLGSAAAERLWSLVADLGTALQELEPICAALAAQRPDRADTLVPEAQGDQRVDGRAPRRRSAASPRSAANSTTRRARLRQPHDDRGGRQPGDAVDQPRTAVGGRERGTRQVPVDEQAPRRAEHAQQDDRRDREPATSNGRAASRPAISPTPRPTCCAGDPEQRIVALSPQALARRPPATLGIRGPVCEPR